MSSRLGVGGRVRARLAGAGRAGRRHGIGLWRRLLQAERRLPPAGEFQIDVGQELGVKQGAVLLSRRAVDPEALAERIQARRRTPETCGAR